MDENRSVINWAIRSNGYVGAYIGEPAKSGKRRNVYQHRWVWEQAHGPIPPRSQIHHRDGNPQNNALSNLECVTHQQHRAIHGVDRRGIKRKAMPRNVKTACSCCGLELWLTREQPAPKCIRCHQVLADKKRTKERECKQCGSKFLSIRGNFCSQRCVNLGARWK